MDIDKLCRATEKLNTLTAQMISVAERQIVSNENLNNSVDELIRIQGGNPPQRQQPPKAQSPSYGSRRF